MPKTTPITRRKFGKAAAGTIAASSAAPLLAAGMANHTPSPAIVPADDKLAIIELMARYAWAYDTSDVSAFAATFTPDGVIKVFGNEMARGREAMPGFLEKGFAMRGSNGWQHLTDHHVFNHYDGRNCTVYSYYLMPESDGNGANVHLRAMGYYVSHCVKGEGRWLFSLREVIRWDGKSPFATK